jgi:hypothetical protein
MRTLLMTRKLTRLQALFAGGAFALAGIAGAPAAALAADQTPAVTDPAATAVVEQVSGAQTSPTSAAPSAQELHPLPITAEQKRFTPDAEQLRNAKVIVDTAKEMGLPPRAWTIAVATSLQESNLYNIGHLGAKNDHDSLGLFQQRPSTGGWGTAKQIQDPHHASTKFLERLVQVDGWDQMPLTKAAQKVQVSAYPNHYAKHEAQAGDIINALHGTGPYADIAASVR